MTNLFWINPVVTLCCFVMALAFLRLKPFDWWSLFIAFMLLTTVVEWAGFYLYSYLGQKNHWLYNLYLPLEIGFFLLVLHRISSRLYRSAGWLWLLGLAFLTAYLIESFRSGFKEYSNNANMIASFGIIFLCLLFYYYLMKQENYVDLTIYPPFWFICGLLTFYLGTVVITIFQRQLTEIYQTTGLPVRYMIMLLLNFIMYSSWSYAFICRSRQKILQN